MSLRKVIGFFGVAGVLGACAVQPQAPGSDALPSTSPQDDFLLYDWLVEEEAATDSAMRVQVTQEDLDALSERTVPLRVGVTKTLDANVAFGGLGLEDLTPIGRPAAHGAIRANGSGFVWTGMVESPGAEGMRLQFEDFYLPRDVVLYQYNDYGDAEGPYAGYGLNSDGEFWAHTMRGDRVYLQLRYDGKDAEHVLGAVRMTVADVGHLQRGFAIGAYRADSNLCPDNASCVQDIIDADPPPSAAVDKARRAVARMTWIEGRYINTCTGSLLADADNSGIPLFLTANHCISKGKAARNMEAWFLFLSTPEPAQENCGILQGTWPTSTLGATLRRTGRTGDFTILELKEAPPSGTEFLEWDDSDIAYANGTPLYRVSHPRWSPQGYSEHEVDTSKGTCGSWPRGAWIYSTDTFGATQGGSSGSPVVNSVGKVVGQLSGGCGTNVNDDCDSVKNATVDGNLAVWIDDARDILGYAPTTCTDNDDDGYCEEQDDCDDNDPDSYPGNTEDCGDLADNDCDGLTDGDDPDCCEVSEDPEVSCHDGSDNDCDGAIDGADTDCGGGECELGLNKDTCNTGADCCSGKCKGGKCRGDG
ncbi:MAG: trypsin-like peptidase domain-containing protein [Deltaproteobacteria bacterium]|nr:trypsin-like peptidase domain-containing protein [Deltaproteobacteria bacterium]